MKEDPFESHLKLMREYEARQPKIVEVVSSVFDRGDYQQHVVCKFNDGEVKEVLTYYPDELSFSNFEFLGLTQKQVREMYHKRDVEYLRGF